MRRTARDSDDSTVVCRRPGHAMVNVSQPGGCLGEEACGHKHGSANTTERHSKSFNAVATSAAVIGDVAITVETAGAAGTAGTPADHPIPHNQHDLNSPGSEPSRPPSPPPAFFGTGGPEEALGMAHVGDGAMVQGTSQGGATGCSAERALLLSVAVSLGPGMDLEDIWQLGCSWLGLEAPLATGSSSL
jgi:hypothetical protein